ncbi:hypothetical protein QMT40_001427 [Parvibaculaceae bacterium PLY_AMNH_Bact1]|nr:hypothetical protein QMT40_001427 [Parvibaculaceae bacterium PLY_AMNH_Bact1]
MTTFATDKQSNATPLRCVGLDAGPQKVLPDLSPSRLAARAFVEGYATPTLEGASYLEICDRQAVNLTAHALACPQVSFTTASTTDKSEFAELGQKVGAQNLVSGGINLANFQSDNLGTFDFVTAADIFSTAATAERMALLVLTKKHLSENGVACIGVDVTPGWDLIEGLRARFCEDVDPTGDMKDQVDLVRTRITNLAKTMSAEKASEQRQLLGELVRLARAPDSEIYRDLLDPQHQSFSISAFLAMADAAKLKPIGDLDPAKSNLDRVPSGKRPADPSALSMADRFGLIDQHTNIRQRQVLLVHADRSKEEFDSSTTFNSLCFSSDLARGDKSLSDKAMLSGVPVAFVGPLTYRTANPIEIVALALMERHKYFPVRGDRLVDHVVAALKPTGIQPADNAEVSKVLRAVVGKLLPAGALVAHLSENRAVSWLSERPILGPLALLQARGGASHLASLLPHSIAVDTTARFILGRLDGTQTVGQIAQELAEAVSRGELTLAAIEGTPEARAKSTTMRVLGHAARSGLLVS